MTLQTRAAQPQDSVEMSRLLGEIIRHWESERPYDEAHIGAHYIAHPDKAACTIVLDERENLLGFQSLKLARAGNQYNVTPGWGLCTAWAERAGHWSPAFPNDACRSARRRSSGN